MARVLSVGIHLRDGRDWATRVGAEMLASRRHAVTMRWTALHGDDSRASSVPHTVCVRTTPAPKFELLNAMLDDAQQFDWVVVVDDDIILPTGWLDRYLEIVADFDLALSQPARTRDSFIDHAIVAQAPGLLARRTRFVEIGPIFCLRRDALSLILPFEAEAGMGWGLDFIWPCRVEMAGLRLGIVDDAPVAHTLRRPAQHYGKHAAAARMQHLLSGAPHLSFSDAFTVIEAYAPA